MRGEEGRQGGRERGRVEEAIMEDGLGERERGRNVLFIYHQGEFSH